MAGIKELLKHKQIKIAAMALGVLIAVLLVLLLISNNSNAEDNDTETVRYEATTAEMQETLTAAGEVTYAESENISFSTSRTFRTMCVEEGEIVEKGQNLISYSDGTYETAPSDGVIVSINAPDTGSVGSSNNLIEFGNTATLSLEITVPEDQINSISEGDKASIVVNSDTSKTFNGTITGLREMSTTLISEKASGESGNSASAGASASTGMGGQSGKSSAGSSDPFGSESSTAYYTVELEFKNDGTLRPGMSANCTVTISDRSDVMVVPVEAVSFNDDDEPYVELVSGGSTKQKKIKTGQSDAENVEILKGLSEGDTIEYETRK